MFLSRIRRLSASEEGFALIGVIGVMVASLALASAASVAAVTTLRGTSADADRKGALAVADAGAQIALTRQNTVAQNGAQPCLYKGAGGQLYASTVEPDGWCAAVTGAVDGGTYSYRTKPNADDTVEIVSTGFDGDLVRRIELSAVNGSGAGVFSDAGLIGLDSLSFSANSGANAGVASDGSISFAGNGSQGKLCGAVFHGVGESLTIGGQPVEGATHGGCPGSTYPVVEEPLTLPPVLQGDVPPSAGGNNDNAQLPGLISGKPNRVEWNPSTRELVLKNNVATTLFGGSYSLCRLELGSNTTLRLADNATVNIFFDDPANCPNFTPGVPQLELGSNSHISPTSSAAVDLRMLFVGSDTIPTQIELRSNIQANESCVNDFIVYAPKTDILVNSNVTYCGAIAGKTTQLESNVTIQSTSAVKDFVVPGAGPHFEVDRFLECPSRPADGTDTGC